MGMYFILIEENHSLGFSVPEMREPVCFPSMARKMLYSIELGYPAWGRPNTQQRKVGRERSMNTNVQKTAQRDHPTSNCQLV
jgi:hypothetical protein